MTKTNTYVCILPVGGSQYDDDDNDDDEPWETQYQAYQALEEYCQREETKE